MPTDPMCDVIDVSFYRHYYDDMLRNDDATIISHWERFGRSENRLPNLEALIASFALIGISLPEDFVASEYLALHSDVATRVAKEWQAVVHYLHSGFREGRPYRITMEPEAGSKKRSRLSLSRGFPDLLDEVLKTSPVSSRRFLSVFDHVDYILLHPQLAPATRSDCIVHFVEVGVFDLSVIAVGYDFDPSFYKENNSDAAFLGEVEAYVHWLNVGLERGDAPNSRVFLKELGVSDNSRYPAGFDAKLYSAMNDGMPQFSSPWRALQHVVEVGIGERKWIAKDLASIVDLFQAAADRLSISQQLQGARVAYETALHFSPLHQVALRHYADCLLRLGEHKQAAVVYQSLIDFRCDNVWTYINIITCYERLGHWHDAVSVAAAARRKFPGDVGLVIGYWDLVTRGFEFYAKSAHRLAMLGHADDARVLMQIGTDLTSIYMNSVPRVMRSCARLEDVVIVADQGLPQCNFYRVEQKVEHLRAAGVLVTTHDYREDPVRLAPELVFADLLILYRVPMTPVVGRVIEQARLAGVRVAYEIDDLMFSSDHFPEDFSTYGGQISEDLYARLVVGTVNLTAALQAADFALASTPPLGRYMASHMGSRAVVVHPNGMSALHTARATGASLERPSSGPVRLFYGTGTKAHNTDFNEIIAPALARLFQTLGSAIHLIIVGYLTLSESLQPYQDFVTQLDPVWNLNAYWDILAEADINIAILREGAIADCKSEIKWLEAAMLYKPSIVTPTETYKEVIEEGTTGLFASTTEDWYNQLRYLVQNDTVRRRIGLAAFKAATTLYSVDALGRRLRSSLEAILVTKDYDLVKPTVVIVNVFFPPQSIGGATRVVADNVRDIKRRFGHAINIEVFCTLEGGGTPYQLSSQLWEGIRVTSITTPNDSNIDYGFIDEAMGAKFLAYLQKIKPEIVHFHCIQRLTSSVCTATKTFGVPYLVTVHDGWWISDSQFLIDKNCHQSLYDRTDHLAVLQDGGSQSLSRMSTLYTALQGAVAVLAVSDRFASIYSAAGLRNVRVVSNGVSDLKPRPKRPQRDHRVRLAHIGGASLHKGYNLIKVALSVSNFDNLSLLVVDHALPVGAKNRTMWGSTEVTFQSKMPQDQVADLYADIDVLLAPSIWPESYGLVTREANQCGVWVVASDRGSIGTDVDSESGFLVDVSSVDPLLEVLATINASPALYRAPVIPKAHLRSANDQASDLFEIYLSMAGTHLAKDSATIKHATIYYTSQVN